MVSFASHNPKCVASDIHQVQSQSAPKITFLSNLTREEFIEHVHHPGTTLPDVHSCDTQNGSDTQASWTPEELHRITGCRRFKNYAHLIQVTRDGKLVSTGEFPPSLGSYSTIRKAARGKSVDRARYRYLDKVHVDIGFGDVVAVGGTKYVVVFVDRATRYNWVFGIPNLSSDHILAAFNLFRAEAGRFAKCFRCDCDPKLFGSTIKPYLNANDSDMIASPAGRQSSNGLVESHWKTMVHMSRAYLTEKQMPRKFWFWSIQYAARMMNMIPGKLRGKLASPFLLVHDTPADCRAWVPLFSVCYFHHEKDGAVKIYIVDFLSYVVY